MSLNHPDKFRVNKKYFTFRNFLDFEKSLAKLSIEEDDKGQIFEIYVEAFLKTTKQFNIKKVYASQKNFPNFVFKKLQIPRRDKGIDGIIIDNNDNIIPYQVKFRSSKKLEYDELKGFKDQSSKAKERVLFTNANYIAEEYFKRGNNIAFRGNDFHSLNKKEINEINKIFNNKKNLVIQEKKIDPYQGKAINGIIKELRNADRTTCLMACGTGKTFVALWYIEKVKAQNIIVFVPSIALLKQLRGEWLSNSKIKNLTSFAVCSDKTEPRSFDKIKLLKKDLNFKIDTDPKEIRKFIKKKDGSTKIIFTTYHSSEAVAKACKGFTFDIGIFDEAHRTTSFSINRQETSFNLGLLDKNISIRKRVFFTATQKSYNRKIVDEFGNPKIKFNMNNPDIYGNVCYRLNFSDAHKLGAISDFKILITQAKNAEISEELRRNSITIVKKNKILSDQVAHQIALKKAINDFNLSKIFTFHSRIPQAKSFAKKNINNTDISTFLPNFYCNYIEAKMDSIKREEIINDFKNNEKGLIANARCLIEGVDVPEVDAIAYVSPKRSKIDIVQSLGRAVRNRHRKDKKYGYVIVPIFSEKFRDERISEAAKRSQYDTISDTLDALREQDNKLDLLLDEANRSFKRGKGYLTKVIKKLRDKIIFVDNEIPVKNFEKHIFLKVLETFRNNWDDMFGLLLKFKDRYKHCDVPLNSRGEFKELASWVHKIRLVIRRKKMNFLSLEQIEELNKIGFSWKFSEETIEYPTKFKTMKDIENITGIGFASSLWDKIKPKGQLYSGESGKYLNYYDLNKEKIKKILKFDYYNFEIDLKKITKIQDILLLLRKPSNTGLKTEEIVTLRKFLKINKINSFIYYDKNGKFYPFVFLTKKEILNFLKVKKILPYSDWKNYYIRADLAKSNIEFYTRDRVADGFKFEISNLKNSKKTSYRLVEVYQKSKFIDIIEITNKFEKQIKRKDLIYRGQVRKFYGSSIYINESFINRYKDLIEKYNEIKGFKDRLDYHFYKIKNAKEFKKSLYLDKIIKDERKIQDKKRSKIKTFYGNRFKYTFKSFIFEKLLRDYSNLVKKIETKHIPLYQDKKIIFKVLNKKRLKKILDELPRHSKYHAQVST